MKPGQRLASAGKVVSQGLITDGPFAEAKEVIGGYWLIIADSLDEAAQLAAQNPCLACGLSYEIRPIESERASAYKTTSETPQRAGVAVLGADRAVRVQLRDLELALDFVSAGAPTENMAYVALDSGHIYWVSEYAPDEEAPPEDVETSDRYVALSHKNELGLGRDLVLSFARDKWPQRYDEIASIFRSKGAYARFKRLLESADRLDQWHEFEARATREALEQWCRNHGLTIADEPEPEAA